MKQMKGLRRQGGWWQYAVAGGIAALSLDNARSSVNASRGVQDATEEGLKIEHDETMRKLTASQEQTRGEVQSRIAGSGFTGKGTFKSFTAELEQEFGATKNFLNRKYESDQRFVRKNAQATRKGIRAGGIGGAISGGIAAIGL